MLKVQSLCFDYQDQPLLHRLNFSLEAGQLMHVKGANGAGKTTLLRLLAGLLQPTSGHIYYAGQRIDEAQALYRQNLCYIGHKPGISSVLTVRENLIYDLHNTNSSSEVEQYLHYFDLQPLVNKPCHQLSAGQRRRVSLLRLLLTHAKIWLLDEPLNALDNHSIGQLLYVLTRHLAQNGLVVLTSHQPLPRCEFPVKEFNLP